MPLLRAMATFSSTQLGAFISVDFALGQSSSCRRRAGPAPASDDGRQLSAAPASSMPGNSSCARAAIRAPRGGRASAPAAGRYWRRVPAGCRAARTGSTTRFVVISSCVSCAPESGARMPGKWTSSVTAWCTRPLPPPPSRGASAGPGIGLARRGVVLRQFGGRRLVTSLGHNGHESAALSLMMLQAGQAAARDRDPAGPSHQRPGHLGELRLAVGVREVDVSPAGARPGIPKAATPSQVGLRRPHDLPCPPASPGLPCPAGTGS